MSTPVSIYTGPTADDLAHIPADLKAHPQWVLWRGADRIAKDTGEITGLEKTPYTTDPDQKADSTDPQTWTSFQRCVDALPVVLEEWAQADPGAYRGGGIGFVFSSDDPYCGIDLDHCVDPDTGQVADWAQAHVNALASYTERTPSGTGLHVLVQGALPTKGRKKAAMEMYDWARFFTMTGWHVPGTSSTIDARHDALYEVHGRVWGPQQVTRPDGTLLCYCPACDYCATLMPTGACPGCGTPPVPVPVMTTGTPPAPGVLLDDTALLEKARAAKNGPTFTAVFGGDASAYGSLSEADLGLCIRLAFWTGDPAQIGRLFRQSGLMRAKWDEQRGAQTYGERTIAEALSRQTEHYTPAGHLQVSSNGSTASQWGSAPGPDAAALAQQLCDDLAALSEDARTPDALLQALPALVGLPPQDWALWKQRFKTLLGQRLNLNDLAAALHALKRHAARHAPQHPPDPRPHILISPELNIVTDAGQAALLKLPHAPIYQRARRLSVITHGGAAPRWLHRPVDMASIALLSPAHLRELAGKAAMWEELGAEGPYQVPPPQLFVDTLLGRPGWPFPVLEGIIHSPTLRPDGSVLDQPGYDADTGLYYDPGATKFPPLKDAPDVFDAAIALHALKDALRDFPFVHSYDRAAALAACLSMVCRFAIRGCVPMFAVTAPVRGSGKSYLVDTLTTIGTGRPAPRWPQVTDIEEERKRILAVALAGYPAIHVDNVTYPLGSPALNLALTTPSFSERILGKSEPVEVPLSLVWLASGNNMQYWSDFARRVVPITIDPAMERPEERTGFTHDPLIPWVQQERPRLTIAALTVVKAFFAAGCPAQGLTTYGSFEPWSNLIRQALFWAGEADCNTGRQDIEATSNPEYEMHAAVLHAWHACCGNEAKTLREVFQDVGLYAQPLRPGVPRTTWHDLFDALAACDRRFDGKTLDAKRIGNDFRTWQGRVIGGLRLISPGKGAQGYALWQVDGTPPSP